MRDVKTRASFYVDQSIQADYCMIVNDDSMKDAGIYSGDVAFLQKDFELKDGKIYAVLSEDDEIAVLKEIYHVNKDNVILMPCTYEFAPLITNINDLIVIGQLIGVYHRIN